MRPPPPPNSGYPAWVQTEEDKADYVRKFEADHPGCKLNPAKIEKNPGRRQLGKRAVSKNYFFSKCLFANFRQNDHHSSLGIFCSPKGVGMEVWGEKEKIAARNF